MLAKVDGSEVNNGLNISRLVSLRAGWKILETLILKLLAWWNQIWQPLARRAFAALNGNVLANLPNLLRTSPCGMCLAAELQCDQCVDKLITH